MMAWYQIISYLFTNGLRIFVGLYLVSTLLELPRDFRRLGIFVTAVSIIVTGFSCVTRVPFLLTGAEIATLMLAMRYLFREIALQGNVLREKRRMYLFLLFFYEIAVALWEFIISAWLGVVLGSEAFLDKSTPQHMLAVWIVRLLMLGIVLSVSRAQKNGRKYDFRVISLAAVLSMLGVVFLSLQNRITIDDGQLAGWSIFSVEVLMAILFLRLLRQYEMEKMAAGLEAEKNGLLERDYQALRNAYAANAKLFHDFHNHMEVLHHYLSKGSTEEAVSYLDDMRSPLQNMTQMSWLGDEAVDYLLGSKIALADSRKIQMQTNVEFPRHTNIRSVDLVAILGNLLDNALDAAAGAEDGKRFIHLTLRRINDMLVIKVENGCGDAPVLADGELQTSKMDQSLHGWGLKNVQTVAGRYDGTVETEYENHVFRAVVTLSFEAVKVQ